MNIFMQVILPLFFILLFCGICVAISLLLKNVCRWLETFQHHITWPLRMLYRYTLGLIPGFGYDPDDGEPEPWPDVLAHLFFAIAAVGVVVFFVIRCIADGSHQSATKTLIYGTTMGSLIGLMDQGISMGLADVMAAGFAGLLSYICMQKARNLAWYFQILYGLIFTCACSILAQLLASPLDSVGGIAAGLLSSVLHASIPGWGSFGTAIETIGILLAAVLSLYLALVLLVITLNEFLAGFRFGAVPFSLFAIFTWTAQFFVKGDFGASLATLLFFFGALLLAEFIRCYPQYDPVQYLRVRGGNRS